LAQTVHSVLEVVSELTDRFELLIIDDGSADATSEVANELTHEYPQVRAICQGECLGREAAIRAGLQQSRGEVVLEHPGLPADRRWTHRTAGHHSQYAGCRVLSQRNRGPRRRPSHPTRPNYLGRMKSLALGE
jgi:hypothetical protein